MSRVNTRSCRGVSIDYVSSGMGNSPSYHPEFRVTDLKNNKILGDYYCDWDAAENAKEYARMNLNSDLSLISVRQIY